MNVPSSFTVMVAVYSSVRNASSRNGPEQMPNVREPSSARTVKRRASGAAFPAAIATWPRGIASVWMTVFVAGSHSQ